VRFSEITEEMADELLRAKRDMDDALAWATELREPRHGTPPLPEEEWAADETHSIMCKRFFTLIKGLRKR
jgi:hypothetical protein